MRIIVERDGKEVEVILASPIDLDNQKEWCWYLNIWWEKMKYLRTITDENN